MCVEKQNMKSRRNGRSGSRRSLGADVCRWRFTLTMYGSTLVETVIVMVVMGIIFLAIMNGLGLFMRLQTGRVEEMYKAGRLREGIMRLGTAAVAVDSVMDFGHEIFMYRSGCETALILADSVLTYCNGSFVDTLLREVAGLYVSEDDDRERLCAELCADGRMLTLSFAVEYSDEIVYDQMIERIERGYGYE